jgi:ABC-type branched-subunit amino acid transport system ATPase component
VMIYGGRDLDILWNNSHILDVLIVVIANCRVSSGRCRHKNHAGKSTVFNLIKGVSLPDADRIVFRGDDITGRPPYRVARAGLARAHHDILG